MSTSRISWHNYFIGIAKKVSERGTCDRLLVGCIIVKDNRILTTGYNGSLPSTPHCDDIGHLMMNGHCIRTNHAERNAVLQAAKNGIALEGATCYCNWKPCLDCMKILVGAGITTIIYDEIYGNKSSYEGEEELFGTLISAKKLNVMCVRDGW